jgi:hypothetical protein
MRISRTIQWYIHCDKCNYADVIIDGDTAYMKYRTPREYFINKGWHDSRGKTLCNTCYRHDKEKNNEKHKD